MLVLMLLIQAFALLTPTSTTSSSLLSAMGHGSPFAVSFYTGSDRLSRHEVVYESRRAKDDDAS